MSEDSELEASKWMQSVVDDHIHERDSYSWSGFPDHPTLILAKRNVRIIFTPPMFEACSREGSSERSSVKERLILIMRDIKVRDYRNLSISLNEQSGYSSTSTRFPK